MKHDTIRVTVEVTQKCINRAIVARKRVVRPYAQNCPVALAFRPLLKPEWRASVSHREVGFYNSADDGSAFGITSLPTKVGQSVRAYDGVSRFSPVEELRAAFKPLRFSLRLPRNLLKPSVVKLAERLNKAASALRAKTRNRNLSA